MARARRRATARHARGPPRRRRPAALGRRRVLLAAPGRRRGTHRRWAARQLVVVGGGAGRAHLSRLWVDGGEDSAVAAGAELASELEAADARAGVGAFATQHVHHPPGNLTEAIADLLWLAKVVLSTAIISDLQD